MQPDHAARQTAPELRERLLALPKGSLVPVDWVLGLLGDEPGSPNRTSAPAVDLNVADLALLFKKKPSTVRAWVERGDFPGAYKLNGKEWRVPPTALDAFQSAQRAQGVEPGESLSAWRAIKGSHNGPREDKER